MRRLREATALAKEMRGRMKVKLDGKSILLSGARGGLHDALASALSVSGASIIPTSADGAAPDILVNISCGAETGPVDDAEMIADHEVDAFATSARLFASRATRVILVISAAALVPVRGAAKFSAHQAAIASLTRTLAMELAPGCLVNALAVGTTEGQSPAALRFLTHAPLRRAATLKEIATAALFLADPMNTYTTGHVMVADGGWTIGYARNF
jgi:NAD(P)-dependent dehydrogenase (short-subunit alcohol dehydrogenase family)